ncbi:hypothetical protein V8J82_18540 [Gymnodinialimonas sp. 2305UL16-5]|uniref:hypothetical protein n=1 Tax=Gymnodinialimonas mytili TaxID=3126503 RepID=UPI00309CEE78
MSLIGVAPMLGTYGPLTSFLMNFAWIVLFVSLVMASSAPLPFVALRAAMYRLRFRGHLAFAIAGAVCALAALGLLLIGASPVCWTMPVCESNFGQTGPVILSLSVSGAVCGLCYHWIERRFTPDGSVFTAPGASVGD